MPDAAPASAAAPAVSATPPGPPGHLTLIGAGHVFAVREAIRDAVLALRPSAVFVELDAGRLRALLAKARGEQLPEPEGFVHRRLARFQDQMAAGYGTQVGMEMVGAVEGAQAVGARLALVDDPADQVLARALRELTWRERLRVAGMAIGGTARRLVPGRRDAKAEVERELARYQGDPAGVLGELQAKFPTLHRVLIAERDERMAARIRAGLAGLPSGVAVVGDGHVQGLLARLGDLAPTVHRLADVREGRLPKPASLATGTTAAVSFGFEARALPATTLPAPPPGPSTRPPQP